MKQTIKTAAAIVGIIVAGCAFWYAFINFMWLCHYAGITM